MSDWQRIRGTFYRTQVIQLNPLFDKSIVYYALSSSSALLMFVHNDLHTLKHEFNCGMSPSMALS